MGFEYLTLLDQFFLMDTEANPITVPSCMVFKRPSSDHCPDEILEMALNRVAMGNRSRLKLVKMFGHYFFKKMTKPEYRVWKRHNTGVL